VDDTGKTNLSEAFTDVSPSTILVCYDPLNPPAIEQNECDQANKLDDDFDSHVNDPADDYKLRNRSIVLRYRNLANFECMEFAGHALAAREQ
jgi:hypothetical protein